MIRLTEQEFIDIIQYFHTHYGINLVNKKILIECRMVKELERCNVSSFADYMRMLKKDSSGAIAGEMVNRLTTNYTYFLREPVHFSILGDKVFPDLFTKKRYGSCFIWCAGCATGEECYTIEMCLNEYREKMGDTPNVRIIATDISEEVLKKAEEGIYPRREWNNIPVTWREKYCKVLDKNHFAVNRSLKSDIRFVKHNLMEPMREYETFDIIFCRNVMIYFDKVSRRRLLSYLEEKLNPGGYLFVGHAELLAGDETNLQPLYPAVYQKMKKT